MEWEFDEMPVFRVNHTKDYTTLSNYHFREKNMSLKAKGLLSLMLSLPDNWDYSINGLVALSKDGINAVKAALSELKEFGYLTIDESRQQGKIGYTYNVYESPELKSKLTVAEKPSTVNRSLKTVDGKTVNDFTAAVNQRQLNTNISNTKELNTKELNTKDKGANRRFTPPTLEEVEAYCIERNNNIDAEQFIDYYEARGWELSKGRKVKDWKACIRTWEKNGYSNKQINRHNTNPVAQELDDFYNMASNWAESEG